MKIIINNKEVEYHKSVRISELFDTTEHKYFAARVNNRLRELDYIITTDSTVELLDLTDSSVTKIYQATLRYLIVMAVKNVFPDSNIRFNYSISRSIFATIYNLSHPFLESDLRLIKNEMDRLIKEDYKINRYSVDIEDAIKYYKSIGWNDKVRILKYRKNKTVHMYECNGFKDYMFGYMLPSLGYLIDYKLKLYSPGFIIMYPRSENNGKIPQFKDEIVYKSVLKEANNWANTVKSSSIADINEAVVDGRALELINICEARHNRQLADLGRKICNNINNIDLICIAGPSSSGKTTFTNRLKIELLSRGIEPLMISLDDFYNEYDKIPLDSYGEKDLESVYALDLELFDKVMYSLIQGLPTKLPKYDFTTKSRSFTKEISINKNQVILIEGIHGLNDLIAPSIPYENKYKIYIAPQAQYSIDDHNPISISDIRLIRRMVRDNSFRSTNCSRTLDMWQSVRIGEFKWIYPYQNNADFVFNSELSYELCVMAKYAIPLLEEVDSTSKHYIECNRLLKFLRYFETISDKWIPCNSILREFIGGSIFYTDDKK